MEEIPSIRTTSSPIKVTTQNEERNESKNLDANALQEYKVNESANFGALVEEKKPVKKNLSKKTKKSSKS